MKTFPDQDKGYARGVSACFAGTAAGHLLIAGGCNFPDDEPGTAKKYYEDIFAAPLTEEDNFAWKKAGILPKPMAYGVSVTTEKGIICAGGNNADGPVTDVLCILFDGETATTEELPALPHALDNMYGALAGELLYVVGGNMDGTPCNACFCLNLSEPEAGWTRLADFPEEPRTQPVCAAAKDGILYMWGGFAGKGPGREATLSLGGYAYFPATGVWTPLPAPVNAAGEEVSLGGGVAMATPDDKIVCAGGVNKDIFLEALRNQAPDYLLHPIEWYRFNPALLVYDTANGVWSEAASSPDLARAGATMVYDGKKGYYLIGGELKPRVRSASLTYIRL